jgi:thiamine biosynthesis lipoprotein
MILALSLSGCGQRELQTYSRDFFAMDTYITCKITSQDQALAERGLGAVEKAFVDIDSLTNRFDQQSELQLINQNAGIAPVKVSQDTFTLVKTGVEWYQRTDGAFNILIGSVMDLWGFGTDHPAVPGQDDVKQALSKADCSKIVLDEAKSTVFLPEKGMILDLGGIAKGYATDKAVSTLQELSIKNALINAGGNVYVLGNKADGTPWRVGVQDPRNPEGIKAVLQGRDQALVSSGDYQRYFEVDGVRYHHIIDPQSGFPSRASAGTTVVMESATIADVLSTALFIKGPQKGLEMAADMPGVGAVMMISTDGQMVGRNLDQYIVQP